MRSAHLSGERPGAKRYPPYLSVLIDPAGTPAATELSDAAETKAFEPQTNVSTGGVGSRSVASVTIAESIRRP